MKDTSVLEDLRRYLSRRCLMGHEVIHRIDRARSAAHPAGSKGIELAGAGAAESPASRPIKAAADPAVEAGPVRREGPQSVRFRIDAPAPAQESLFAEKRTESSLDLSKHDLASLEKVVAGCTRCRLSETRTKTVFGSGSAKARIVFIGEAPGREEDLQGLPFVGRAGQLLTKILASVGMSRDEVYIANILKCRPPENRDPQEDEVRSCEIYLRRQLELIDPVLVCALGRIAAQSLLHCAASLSALRENLHFYNDTKVIVTYHPAALLRNPNLKRSAWEDIKTVRRMYDEALGGR